jgi:phosphohistidine phosphatase
MIDPGESDQETALKEAWEEAGIKGRLIGDRVGTYEYEKVGAILRVSVFVMQVSRQAAVWPEADTRERRWVSVAEAVSLLDGHGVRSIYQRIEARLA